jgi:uncharacterized protein (TIGR03435 family)
MKVWMLLCIAAPAVAQPAFIVASVKPAEPGKPVVAINDARLTLTSVTLKSLIGRAYAVKDFQVAGPDWISSLAYNVEATMPPATPDPVVAQMLQSLLADRFQLQLKRSTQETPVYALVVGKNGPKLKPAQGSETSTAWKGGLKATALTAQQLCNLLGKMLNRPVVDQTGLTGTYDIAFEFTPDPTLSPAMSKMAAEAAMAGRDSMDSSIFTAVQEQLGLRLEPRKLPMDKLIVESALKVPTEN